MKIKVLLFAQLKEALGCHEMDIEVPEKTTVRGAADQILRDKNWKMENSIPLRYAVNEEFCPENNRLHPNDTLAILSPVAGG